jgi:hypothetical protein
VTWLAVQEAEVWGRSSLLILLAVSMERERVGGGLI